MCVCVKKQMKKGIERITTEGNQKKKTPPILGRSNWINKTVTMNPSTKSKDTNLTKANKDL